MIKFFFQPLLLSQISYPIIQIHRYQIKKWLKFWKFIIYIDPSNRQINFRRNRIRLFILPFLKYFLHFQIDTQICKFIYSQREVSEYFYLLENHLMWSILVNKTFSLGTIPKIFKKLLMKKCCHYCHLNFSQKDILFMHKNLIKNSKVNKIKY